MEIVTTPFGRRPMTLAIVKQQIAVSEIKLGKSVNKWEVLRNVEEAQKRLDIPCTSLAVLDALLTFHPGNELQQEAGLTVFPSNERLMRRARVRSGATLRRHLAQLVNAGLIYRRDSANGKRFARKKRDGSIEHAFGFDLSPLLLRAEELATMAEEVVQERMLLRQHRGNLTILNRDVRKLISAAIEERVPADWDIIESSYLAIVKGLTRSPCLSEVRSASERLTLLREEVLNALNKLDNANNMSTNAVQNERHIQNSPPESLSESEPSSREEQVANAAKKKELQWKPMQGFPLGMVLKACPDVADYGPGGSISGWRDLMKAAVVVRSTLGVSQSAYEEACEIMGPENAAVAMACILERAGHINSPGGYLRDLTRKAERREFSLGPMLMALLRTKAAAGHRQPFGH